MEERGGVQQMHGFGELHFTNGSVYVGQFNNGQRHGFGVWSEPDGQRYYGNWKDDEREGYVGPCDIRCFPNLPVQFWCIDTERWCCVQRKF